ncbi:HAMP domain-containing histidine kinase [Flavihumibacter rivuli]|uniref:sensor histidine kinase n=1 Tax=Flavihumibacter rivuli TaxID=2838156 RepID=UPI001BDEFEBB|nr:ATP-binding protein [Flavihumibacter rivuli]ULQ56358.1 HAMP domain-containing histidine kinase [Flavihumibacter rivuli]
MFNLKNLSPRQVAAINAFSISLLVGLANLILLKSWQIALASFAVLFLVAYLLIFYFLQQFIYRRIKLIYKFIYQTKATKREEFYNKYVVPQKSIDEVSQDVEKWAQQRQGEIELLKKNEAFRKEFLQNLAHEFKTPIFAIQGYVDTLLGGAMDNPDIRKKFLENTSRNVDRLVNLMNDLDEISRLERGEQVLYKQHFVIQDLIREVMESLSIKINQKEIMASIKKGCESPVNVFADKEKIRQVLINLIENATKYGKPGGSIVVSIYKTDLDKALIEISDDGIGIEEEHLLRIFERFYRTDKARSRDKGGTGLGLAICKHIVEAHGESMHVRSKPDVGTTIGFTLALS